MPPSPINPSDAGPVIGIGVDIVDVPRIQDLRERQGERFLARVFTEGELAYCGRMKHPDKHYAARFAAKEAVSKAFGTGIGGELNFTSIAVVIGERGQPTIELDEKGQALLASVGGRSVMISLSHTDTLAIAYATIVG